MYEKAIKSLEISITMAEKFFGDTEMKSIIAYDLAKSYRASGREDKFW